MDSVKFEILFLPVIYLTRQPSSDKKHIPHFLKVPQFSSCDHEMDLQNPGFVKINISLLVWQHTYAARS